MSAQQNVNANFILWKRQDGKIFFHAEYRGNIISHRFGPFDNLDEIGEFLKKEWDQSKSCGPIGDYQLAKMRRAIAAPKKKG